MKPLLSPPLPFPLLLATTTLPPLPSSAFFRLQPIAHRNRQLDDRSDICDPKTCKHSAPAALLNYESRHTARRHLDYGCTYGVLMHGAAYLDISAAAVVVIIVHCRPLDYHIIMYRYLPTCYSIRIYVFIYLLRSILVRIHVPVRMYTYVTRTRCRSVLYRCRLDRGTGPYVTVICIIIHSISV